MKTLLAVLVLLPGLASAQSSDSSFAAALCAVRATAAAAVKAAPVKGAKPAAVRSEAKPAAPANKLCDEAMSKHIAYNYGGPTLLLQTETTAYYSHQDCDICDELDSCELATGKISTLKTAHMVGCQDVAPYRKGKIVYDACGPIR